MGALFIRIVGTAIRRFRRPLCQALRALKSLFSKFDTLTGTQNSTTPDYFIVSCAFIHAIRPPAAHVAMAFISSTVDLGLLQNRFPCCVLIGRKYVPRFFLFRLRGRWFQSLQLFREMSSRAIEKRKCQGMASQP